MSSWKNVVGLLLLGVCLFIPAMTSKASSDLTIDIARIGDVKEQEIGDADAMLVGFNGSYMVVDTGRDIQAHKDTLKKMLTERDILKNKKITAVTITHFDGDHVGGFPALLTLAKTNKVNIYRVYARNYDKTQLEYLQKNRSVTYVHYIKFLNAIASYATYNGSVKEVKAASTTDVNTVYNFSKDLKDNSKNVNGNKFWISPSRTSNTDFLLGGTAQVEWLNRNASYLQTEGNVAKAANEVNNDSLVFKITSGTKSMIFLGDIAGQASTDLINSNKNLKATAVKIAHHGWSGSTSLDLMTKIDPSFSVVTTADASRLAHMKNKNVGNLYYVGKVSLGITTITFNTTQRISNYIKYEF